MYFSQVEINQPGACGGLILLILPVVSVRQAAVHEMTVSFRIDRAVPRGFLMKHDLAERIEHSSESSCAGHSMVVVHAVPRRYGSMNVAVGGAELVLFLYSGSQHLAELYCPGWFGGIAPGPRSLQLLVRQPVDHIYVPVFVDRGEVGEVVVGAVHEAQLILQNAGIVVCSFIPALFGSGMDAKSKAFSTVAPHDLMVGDDHFGHAISVTARPEANVILVISRSVSAP